MCNAHIALLEAIEDAMKEFGITKHDRVLVLMDALREAAEQEQDGE